VNSDSPVKKLFVVTDADSRRDSKSVCTTNMFCVVECVSNLLVCYSRVCDIYLTVMFLPSFSCLFVVLDAVGWATGRTSGLESSVPVVSVDFTSNME